jgi:hypothetical protein
MRINSFYVMLVIFCVAGAGLLALWRRALPGFIIWRHAAQDIKKPAAEAKTKHRC